MLTVALLLALAGLVVILVYGRLADRYRPACTHPQSALYVDAKGDLRCKCGADLT